MAIQHVPRHGSPYQFWGQHFAGSFDIFSKRFSKCNPTSPKWQNWYHGRLDRRHVSSTALSYHRCILPCTQNAARRLPWSPSASPLPTAAQPPTMDPVRLARSPAALLATNSVRGKCWAQPPAADPVCCRCPFHPTRLWSLLWSGSAVRTSLISHGAIFFLSFWIRGGYIC